MIETVPYLSLFFKRQAFVQLKMSDCEYALSKGIPPHNIVARD